MVDIQEWIEDDKNKYNFEKRKKEGDEKDEDGDILDIYIEREDSKDVKNNKEEYFTGKLKMTKELKKNNLDRLVGFSIRETFITELNLSECPDLSQIIVSKNPNLTSIDFLVQLPNPQKLKHLNLSCGNFAATTLDFLAPFVGLEDIDLSVARYESDKCGVEKLPRSE